jgi:hypothetical protein
MKHLTLLSFFLLFGSIALSAQTSAQTSDQNKTQTVIVAVRPENGACPVSVHAKQAGGGEMQRVDRAHPKGGGQGVHLILTNPDSRQIIGAKVTVRGLTAKNRVLNTLSIQDDSSDAAKTLSLTFSADSGKEASTDIWVPGLTAIQSIDLNTLTYADGSTRQLSAGMTCRTIPDAVMLVGTR